MKIHILGHFYFNVKIIKYKNITYINYPLFIINYQKELINLRSMKYLCDFNFINEIVVTHCVIAMSQTISQDQLARTRCTLSFYVVRGAHMISRIFVVAKGVRIDCASAAHKGRA